MILATCKEYKLFQSNYLTLSSNPRPKWRNGFYQLLIYESYQWEISRNIFATGARTWAEGRIIVLGSFIFPKVTTVSCSLSLKYCWNLWPPLHIEIPVWVYIELIVKRAPDMSTRFGLVIIWPMTVYSFFKKWEVGNFKWFPKVGGLCVSVDG